jgi:hypothetical protein
MSGPRRDCPQCNGFGYVVVSVLTRRHGVQSTEASCPTCCAPPEEYVRAWRAQYRWQQVQRPCRHCQEWTHLRDHEDEPAHWVCAARAACSFDPAEAVR